MNEEFRTACAEAIMSYAQSTGNSRVIDEAEEWVVYALHDQLLEELSSPQEAVMEFRVHINDLIRAEQEMGVNNDYTTSDVYNYAVHMVNAWAFADRQEDGKHRSRDEFS